jgi:hypothetical protein
MSAPIYVDSFQSQQARIAVESQYGVMPAVPSWLRLSDMRLIPKPQYETEFITGSGDEAPSGGVVNDESTNVDVQGRPGYTGGMYPMSSLFGFPTDAPVSGTTYDHTWTYDGKTPVMPASYALHYGLPNRVRQALGFIFNGWTFGVARSGMNAGASGFAKAIEVGTSIILGGTTDEVQTGTVTGAPTALAPTLTFKGRSGVGASQASWTAAQVLTLLEAIPTIGVGNVIVAGGPWPGTAITVRFTGKLGGIDQPLITTTGTTFTAGTSPTLVFAQTTAGADVAVSLPNQQMMPLHFNVWVDDTWAALGTTQMMALYSGGFAFGNRWARSMPVNSSKSSDGIFLTENQEHTVNMRLGADATADAMIATIKAGAKKFVRIFGVGGATGDAALKYEFQADFCILLGGTDGYDSEGGIHVMTWNGRLARDDVSGNCFVGRLRNRRASL